MDEVKKIRQQLRAEAREKLARLIHESGRAAVECGAVLVKPNPPIPFKEWDELPEEAKQGRRMQAAFLSHGNRAKRVVGILEEAGGLA
jgi:hypothetical protein